MNAKDMDKIINDTVTDTMKMNADNFQAGLQKDLDNRNNNDDGLAAIIYRSMEAAARYGAISAISTLCKLHVLDIGKIQKAD
jgi:hypothetical protein